MNDASNHIPESVRQNGSDSVSAGAQSGNLFGLLFGFQQQVSRRAYAIAG